VVIIATGQPTLAMTASPQSDDCEVTATTRHSVAGRDCEGKPFAHVDHRPAPHNVWPRERNGERPIDRLRSRGEGALKASDERDARRELREEPRRQKKEVVPDSTKLNRLTGED
jgi:hypothetical protein